MAKNNWGNTQILLYIQGVSERTINILEYTYNLNKKIYINMYPILGDYKDTMKMFNRKSFIILESNSMKQLYLKF